MSTISLNPELTFIQASQTQIITALLLLTFCSTLYLLFSHHIATSKMLTGVLILGTLSAAFLTPSALCETPTNPDLSRKLKSALTRVEFVNELEDKDSVFDFGKVVGNPYNPGSVLNANAATFPMLTSSGMTVAQINLGPCAMLAHHLHPRAHNVVVSISGTTKTYMRTENGANDIVTTLTPGKVTMFYAGSIHEMHNEGRLPVTLPIHPRLY